MAVKTEKKENKAAAFLSGALKQLKGLYHLSIGKLVKIGLGVMAASFAVSFIIMGYDSICGFVLAQIAKLF